MVSVLVFIHGILSLRLHNETFPRLGESARFFEGARTDERTSGSRAIADLLNELLAASEKNWSGQQHASRRGITVTAT